MGKHGTKEFIVGISVSTKVYDKVRSRTRVIPIIRPVKNIAGLGFKVGVLYVWDEEEIHGLKSFDGMLVFYSQVFTRGNGI